jgi:deoxyribodipyrimidine photo-lyase
VTTALWWIRRDLRLSDNQALATALSQADQVLPVFIIDPALLASPYVGPKRTAFLFAGLRQLDSDLRARGSRLIVRHGSPETELGALMSTTTAHAIYAEADFSPFARRRDDRVRDILPLVSAEGLTVHPPGAISKPGGAPYSVFSPFRRRWMSLPRQPVSALLPPPASIPTPAGVEGISIPPEPALPPAARFRPGEGEAQRRLSVFVDGLQPPIQRYAETRDRLDLDGTSQLSPYLRFGMLSIRQAVAAASEAAQSDAGPGAETWLSELVWREFFISILYHFPRARRESFRRELRRIPWENDAAAFAAWCDGRTGYPVVDAAMRQLSQTGWMPNRARMIVGSFLVKDLLIDWRWGERWFMQHLLDGDPAANNGGWQWTAGTGTDAAPYFRVFNPVLQGERYDPHGDYVRRWLPELNRVPARFVHKPWELSLDLQRECGCVIGHDYPAPIVDHAEQRKRALALYRQAKDTADDSW